MSLASPRRLPMSLLASAVAVIMVMGAENASAADPPGPTAIGGQKILTLVVRDPPALRCNNNIQVAAELANIYKVPVVIVPAAFANPGTNAPAVWYGRDLIAEDGGPQNGMVSFTQIADILEIENVPKQPQSGRLTDADVKPKFDALKQQIKQVP